MKRTLSVSLLALLSLCSAGSADRCAAAETGTTARAFARQFVDDVGQDYSNFYRPRPLGALWCGLAAAGAVAHTRADEEVRTWYQQSARSVDTDRAAAAVKPLGNHWIALPVFAGAGLLGALDRPGTATDAVGEWGQRSLRALALGAPVVGALQWTLGSSRPTEAMGSEWRPFKDDNGVSGHAFVGAVPFLSAAAMVKNRAAKSALVLGSVLCGLSRVNDDAHYLSQAGLGWWAAYLSAGMVERTASAKAPVAVVPVASQRAAGLGIAGEF